MLKDRGGCDISNLNCVGNGRSNSSRADHHWILNLLKIAKQCREQISSASFSVSVGISLSVVSMLFNRILEDLG